MIPEWEFACQRPLSLNNNEHIVKSTDAQRTFLLILEIAQPAKDPAAPAAELTNAAGTGPVVPKASSRSLLGAISG